MRFIAAIAVLSLTAPLALGAQEAGSGPRAGAWGAEVSFDADNAALGGALLRFRNDRSAWVLGVDGSVLRREHEQPMPFGDLFEDDVTSFTVGGRFGVRSFRAPGATIRPIMGAGILGNIAQTSGLQRAWDAGIYGEIGISRFFGENFSIGVLSDVQLTHGVRRGGTLRASDTRLGFDALRMTATVIF